MDKIELIEALEDERQELLDMLDSVPDESWEEPGVAGDWSVKDIIAHLTYWEGQLVTLLFQCRNGKTPTTVQLGKEPVDEVNKRWYETTRERSSEAIWQDFLGVRKQSIRRTNEFSEIELNDPNLFPWLNGLPLWQWIVNDTIEHEEEHADQIREWLDQRDARSNGNNPRSV